MRWLLVTAAILTAGFAMGCGSDTEDAASPAASAGGFELSGAENLSLTAECDCPTEISKFEVTIQNLWDSDVDYVVAQTSGEPLPSWMSLKVTSAGSVPSKGTAKLTGSAGSTSSASCCAATAFEQDLSFTVTPVKGQQQLADKSVSFNVHVAAPKKPKLSVPTDTVKLSCLVLSDGSLANCSQATVTVTNTGDGHACVKTTGCIASEDKMCIGSQSPDDFTIEPGASQELSFMSYTEAGAFSTGTVEVRTSCESFTIPVSIAYNSP